MPSRSSFPSPSSAPQGRDESLGTERIGKLLARLSIPAMIGMFVNALYNLVDTIFIGHAVGPAGIGGLSISFPFQILLFAISTMIGIGGASVCSRALGAGDMARARRAAGNAFVMSAVLGVAISVVGYLFLDEIVAAFGATPGLVEYARDYLEIIVLGSPFLVVAVTGNILIRSEGRAKVAMVTMLVGTGGNLILDPIFIFGFGMGVRGAAWATVIGYGLSFVFVLYFFLSRRSSLAFTRADLRIAPGLSREILAIGFPNFMKQVGGSVLVIVVNNILRVHGGDVAIATFGVINRILMFAVMPVFGIVQGFQPIVGYNYGARNFERVREVVRTASIATTICASVFFVGMMGFPGPLMSIFGDDPELIALGTHAMRIVVLVLPIIGIQLVGATFFMAIGKAFPALMLSIARQIVFLIPLVIIFPIFWGSTGVWVAFPVADTLATVVTIVWMGKELRNLPSLDPGAGTTTEHAGAAEASRG
jgi:putative MATE family efflux protein